jgi:S1-C subfamily serine protease
MLEYMSTEAIHPGNPSAALLTVSSQVPERALTAPLLGTERSGHAIRIRADGLALTVGYLVNEAEQIWMTSAEGQAAPAYLVAQDHDSGLALLKPTLPIGSVHLEPGRADRLPVGEPLTVLRSGGEARFECTLTARHEFAGRWEYLIDDALFTAPACDDWSGAALVDRENRLCGIGSLLLEIPGDDLETTRGNMFVPLDLVSPYLDELCRYGQRRRPARPWLGSLIQEHEDQLIVVGTYPDCPASRAGIEPGDVVVSVDGTPARGLANLLRSVWSLGSAGVEVPLTIARDGAMQTCRLRSMDRAAYYHLHAAGTRN